MKRIYEVWRAEDEDGQDSFLLTLAGRRETDFPIGEDPEELIACFSSSSDEEARAFFLAIVELARDQGDD